MMKVCIKLFCLFVCFGISAQEQFANQIDSILKEYDQVDVPGFSVNVFYQNKVHYSKGFGIANLDYSIKNSDSTIFSLASVSKQFTASAIWALQKEGKINLDDDVRMYLPELPKYNDVIKISHLLNHTSGIRNYHALMSLSGFDYNNTYYDNQYVYELACKQRGLNNVPGEKVTYSNTNYNLLAIIIERISGMNLNEYLVKNILKPLKMNHTFVRVSRGSPIRNKAIGYQKRKNEYVFSSSNQLSYGAGSMGSSTNDMLIWMKMLNGQVSKFEDLAKFLQTTETLTNGEKAKYARGLSVDNYKGHQILSHGGFGFGGRSQMITIPELRIGIIVLSNLQSINSPRIAYQILDILLDKKANKEEIQENKGFNTQDLNLFAGEYKEINSDMAMKLFIENDTLKSIGSIGKVAASLVQFDKNKFHRVTSQNVKYEFLSDKNHDMIIAFGGTPFYFRKAVFIEKNTVVLSDYSGEFYSEELDVVYNFFVENGNLKLSYADNKNISLNPVQLNQFGNGRRTLYHFIKDKNNTVSEMQLSSEGTISGIKFKKKATTN
ncbi:serine hydrolase domain-containing protein [Winogradskyella litorisediminis]|uniref:Serine hydrolase domain-containing protein n=1 Tax=Winogradskyella litorisediminis TaxID=1156618 RepID=A0ABW3N737_9FLAO